MKYLILFLLTFPIGAAAQSFQMSFKAEQTVKGVYYELGSAYELKSNFAFGVFYQRNELGFNNDGVTDFAPLYGLALYAPLYSGEKLALRGLLRGGLVSDRFFVVIPAIETRMMVFRRTGITVTTGYRHGYPSAALGLVYKLTMKG
jgi:hypothetical protein